MNVPSLTAFFDQSTSLQVTWLILHFLWQGVAIAFAVLVVNLILARKSPKLRYGVAVAGMAAMISSVVTTWFLLQPAVPAIDTSNMAVSYDVDPATHIDPTRAMIDLEPIPEPRSALAVWAPAATAVYVLGLAIMLLRLLFSAIGVGRLRLTSKCAGDELITRVGQLSRQISLRMKPTLKTCERVVVPFVAGVIKPAILLPSLMATGMTQPELDAILLHELAHLRRGDLLVNFLQRIVESLLFFHPAVWYVSRVITVERENCCDDIVLGHCSQNVYASALVRMAEACAVNSAEIGPIVALASTGTSPSQLKRRVMRILGVKPARQFHKPGFGVLLACVIAVTITAVHLQAQSKGDEATQTSTEEAGSFEPLWLSGVGNVDKAPLTISFDLEGNIVGFAVTDAGSMHRLVAILHNLTARQSVVITSMNVRRSRDGLTMTVLGQNLDIADIQSAMRKADPALLEALTITREVDDHKTSQKEDTETSPTRIWKIHFWQDNNTSEKEDTQADRRRQKEETDGKLMELRLQAAKLADRFAPEHPRRKAIEKQIKVLEESLAEELQQERSIVTAKQKAKDQLTNEKSSAPNITGPIRFEIIGNDQFNIRGSKEDVDRVMKLVEKNWDKNKPARKEAENDDKAPEPVLTDPVRIEFIEDTDIFIVRGKKEDVDRIMKVIKPRPRVEKSQPDEAEPGHAEGATSEPKRSDSGRLDHISPLSERREARYSKFDLGKPSPAQRRISAALESTVKSLVYKQKPLAEVIAVLEQEYDIPIQFHEQALKDEGIDATKDTVTIDVSHISLRSALRLLLANIGLTYVIDNEVLMITSVTEAQERLSKMAYPVGGLQLNGLVDRRLFVSYKLKNALAGPVAQTLRQIFHDVLTDDADQGTVIKADVENNRILVRATRKEHEAIAGMVKEFVKSPVEGWTFRAINLRTVSAEQVAQTLQKMFDDTEDRPAIHAEPTTNRLVIRAKPDQHEQIEVLLSQLAGAKAPTPRHLLGIAIAPAPDGQPGVLVRSVVPGTLVEAAGIRAGDILLRYDDEAVTTESLPKLIQQHKNKSPKLTFDRNGKVIVISNFDVKRTIGNEIRILQLRERLEQLAKQLQSSATPSLSDRDNTFREIVELKNQILELEAEDQRRKPGDEALLESLNQRQKVISFGDGSSIPFIDAHIFQGRTPQGKLRFPVEVERAMMGDRVRTR